MENKIMNIVPTKIRHVWHLFLLALLCINGNTYGQTNALSSSTLVVVFDDMLQYYNCKTCFYCKIIPEDKKNDLYISIMTFASVRELPKDQSFYIYKKDGKTIIVEKSYPISINDDEVSNLAYCPNIDSLYTYMKIYPDFNYCKFDGMIFFPEIWRYKISFNKHLKMNRKVALDIFNPIILCDESYWPLNKTLYYAAVRYTNPNPLDCLTKTLETIQKEKPMLVLPRKSIKPPSPARIVF